MRSPNSIGRKTLRFKSIDSTQDIAIEYAKKGEAEGLVVLAEEQRKGRGRWNRDWFSPPSKALIMSFLLRPRLSLKFSPYLALFPAIACAQAIERRGIRCSLKWPNDILIEDKKTGGILVEMENEGGKTEWAVIGIGINVNLEERDFPSELRETATSLCLASGKKLDIEDLLEDILEELNEGYALCLSEEGRANLRKMWEGRDALKGKVVEVKLGGEKVIKGIEDGIDEQGFLKVRVGKNIVVIPAGDVYLLRDKS